MAQLALQGVDALDGEGGVSAKFSGRGGGDDACGGEGVRSGLLDLEPAIELGLVGPEGGHGGTGVAGNHAVSNGLNGRAAILLRGKRPTRMIGRAVFGEAATYGSGIEGVGFGKQETGRICRFTIE